MFWLKRSRKGASAEFFRLDRPILYVIAIDILFYLCLAGSIYLLNLALLETFHSLEGTYSTLEKLGPLYEGAFPANAASFTAELKSTQDILRAVVINSTIILVAYAVLAVVLISLLKGIIWAKVSKQGFSLRFFSRFLLLNYLWLGLWAAVFWLSFILFKSGVKAYIAGLAFLLFVYSSAVVRASFNEKEGIFRIFKDGIKRCFKVKLSALACIIIGFVAFTLASYIVFLMVQGVYFMMIIVVLLSVYSAFARRCIFRSVKLSQLPSAYCRNP